MTELCQIYGLVDTTVMDWIRSGMPTIQKPSTPREGWKLDTAEVYRWRLRREREEGRREVTGFAEANDPRARKQLAEAKLAELNFLIRTGKVVEIADVEQLAVNQIIACRSKLLAIPSRFAPVLAVEDDAAACEQALLDGVTEAIEELDATAYRKLGESDFDYAGSADPGQSREPGSALSGEDEEAVGESFAAMGPASEADNLAMGRPESSPIR